MNILLTGFEPFGGEKMNPSWQAVMALPDKRMVRLPSLGEGAEESETVFLYKREIPVVYRKAPDAVRAAIREVKPTIVICVGQAGGRKGITPERLGVNLRDAAAPDNEGTICTDEVIDREGPAAYWTKLPVKRMVQAMKDNGLSASVSYSAGTYVCNDVLYSLLNDLSRPERQALWGGFIHVPFALEQGKHPEEVFCMKTQDMTKGLEICVEEAVRAYCEANRVRP